MCGLMEAYLLRRDQREMQDELKDTHGCAEMVET